MLSGLVASGAVMTTGCLVAEAPEYGPPQQSPPVINTQGVTPSQYVISSVDESRPLPINVPYRSEDAGENLVAALYLDWNPDPDARDPTSLITDRNLPASSFDQTDRSFSYVWSPDDRVATNCSHTLTLLLLHESNYDDPFPKDNVAWDIASVTWRVDVLDRNVPVEPPNVVAPCLAATGAIP